MSSGQVIVLDASVGVKWFKGESGSDEARGLLQAHRAGDVRLVVPAQFTIELVAVAARRGSAFAAEVWSLLYEAHLTIVGVDDAMVAAALNQCDALGCSFYDALAPALATMVRGTLCSADARAHGRFEGVRLIG